MSHCPQKSLYGVCIKNGDGCFGYSVKMQTATLLFLLRVGHICTEDQTHRSFQFALFPLLTRMDGALSEKLLRYNSRTSPQSSGARPCSGGGVPLQLAARSAGLSTSGAVDTLPVLGSSSFSVIAFFATKLKRLNKYCKNVGLLPREENQL